MSTQPIITDVDDELIDSMAPDEEQSSNDGLVKDGFVDDTDLKYSTDPSGVSKTAKKIGLVVLLWIILGVIGFIMSIACFARGGTIMSNILGLLVSLLFGPFYFVYYYVARGGGYCV